ncbi:MAG TPA: TolC family protein [Hanamia sp.]
MNRSLINMVTKRYSVLFFGVLFIFLNLFSPLVKGQEVKELSLQETINLSLKNSHILQASSAKIEQAQAQVKQAQNNRLPNASVSGSYLYLANPSYSLKTKSGGSDTSGNRGGLPKINQAMYGIFSVSLPIFTGGKIKYVIESAKYLEQAMTLDADQDKEAVILNSVNAYINLYKASVTLNVVKENLAQSRKTDSVLSRLEENGLLARNDLLKSELQTSNIELSLLDAESNLKMANVSMDLMIGYPETTILKPDTTNIDKAITIKTLDEYEQMALQNRKDMQALNFRKQSAVAGISMAKSDLYPSIALSGGDVAANIPGLVSISLATNIGVGVKYDLSSLWKSKANIAAAKSRVTEISANQAQLSDDVRLQVNQSYEDYLLSQKKTEVYNVAVVQAEENYRITKNKFDNSLVTTTDLLDANVALLTAQIRLAVARADVLLAYSKLLETSGILSNTINQ